MNKTALFVLITFCLTSCAQSNKSTNTRVLTFDTKLEILDDSKSESTKNYLNQKYGDSVNVTYDSRGNIRTDYLGSGEMGLIYNFYNSERRLSYTKWKNLDTLYYYDATINEYPLDSVKRNTTPNGFVLTYYSQNPYAEGDIIQEFHFLNDSLVVNAKLYKDFKDFSFGEIIADSKRLPIKTVSTVEGIRITRNLLRVEHIEDPKKSFFEPNTGIPLKEL